MINIKNILFIFAAFRIRAACINITDIHERARKWTKINVNLKKGVVLLLIAAAVSFLPSCLKNENNLSEKQIELNKKLEEAAYKDDWKLVRKFIRQGADPNLRFYKNQTLLFYAVNVDLEITKFLIEHGADINAKNEDNKTPIFSVKNRETAQYLIDHGATFKNIKNIYGLTPLGYACHLQYFEKVNVLLENGAEVDDSSDPLHRAVGHGNYKLTKLLFKYGADVNRQDKGGKTPLHVTAYNGDKKMALFLLKKGADLFIKDNYGDTPVKTAKRRQHSEMRIFLQRIVNKKKKLKN